MNKTVDQFTHDKEQFFAQLDYLKLPAQVSQILHKIEENPLLLKDNPQHSVINFGKKIATFSLEDLGKLVHAAYNKQAEAIQQFLLLDSNFKKIEQKSLLGSHLKEIRNKFNPENRKDVQFGM